MPKLFSISSKQLGVIFTLMILIFLGASYFFIYVPNNEKNVQERRFRCLQNIDSNIRFKMDNNIALINNLLSQNNNLATLRAANKANNKTYTASQHAVDM